MFVEGNSYLALRTGGTERARIDTSGNMGIGETSPSGYRLNVKTPNSQGINLNGTGTGGAWFQFANNGTVNGYIASAYHMFSAGSQTDFGIRAENNLVFGIGASEKARIDSSGVLLVNRTGYIAGVGSSCKLQVLGGNGEWSLGVSNGGSTQPYGILMTYGTAVNTSNWPFFQGSDTSATRFAVYSNGGIANYQANDVNLSDRREKTNFAPAKSYLDTICAIPVQTFNYIDQNMEDDGGLTLGVVAQDVQAVAPELVMESNWGTKDNPKMRLSIYQTDLQYALMKCIQEQQAIIESLKARLDAANL
jgi:hypothetical protein